MMKKMFWAALVLTILCSCGCAQESTSAKPVIYLYPEEETEVSVQLNVTGELTTTYPAYADGWTVTAEPDGTLYDAAGREYTYLFWEAEQSVQWDFSTGYCVRGADTAEFLQEALAARGLTPREYNEFIVYWLPQMEGNAWNLISFQGALYEENAGLTVTPAPDSVLRVFMAWKPVDAKIEIAPQVVEPFERTGFTLVEWGGVKVE